MSSNKGLLAATLIVLTMVAYLPATRGEFIWDDDMYVSKNPLLHEPGGLNEIWFEAQSSPQYYPLVFTSFWVEHKLWGLDPKGYHWTNILLHAANAILVWLVFRRLEVPACWFIGALFAVHPVHVESVAWITERKNVLSAFFYGLAMLAFLRFFLPNSTDSEKTEKTPWDFYVLGMLLFVGALLSKTVTCSLPAALVLILWWKHGHLRIRDIAALVPLFVIGAGFAYLTVDLEKTHVGAQGQDWAFSFADRCLIAGRAAWFYATKLLLPVNLSFIYPRWTIDASNWPQWLYPLSAVALVLVSWLFRHRFGRGPVVALLYFGGTLVPALGFFNVFPMLFSFVADHFQYLASIGLLALVAVAVWQLVGPSKTVVGTGIVVVLAILTWRQCGIYRNLETLWTDTVAKNSSAWMAHYHLAQILAARGAADPASRVADFPAAQAHLEAVIKLRPGYWRAYNDLGSVLGLQGKNAAAIPYFQKAIEANPKEAVGAHVNLARALLATGEPQAALAAIENVSQQHNAETHYLKGTALLALKRPDEAISAFREAVKHDAKLGPAAFELGKLLLQQGQLPEAVDALQRAVEAQPNLVAYRLALGNALQKQGRNDEANVHFRRALELDPNSPLR